MIRKQREGQDGDLQGGIIGNRGGACARGLGRWEGSEEGLGVVQECSEASSSKAGGEEVQDRRCPEEVATGLPEKVAVDEDVSEGITIAAVRAGSGIAGRGVEVIGVISVKGMSCDELEARRLKGL